MPPGPFCGWSGTVAAFLASEASEIVRCLAQHEGSPSTSQLNAWRQSISALREVFEGAFTPSLPDWRLVFEYELPREGGRRPDLVILTRSTIIVCEFKGKLSASAADIDQVAAYARDLSAYHAESHGHKVVPVLVLNRAQDTEGLQDGVRICNTQTLGVVLMDLASDSTPGRALNPEQWLASEYAPLPSLVEAARLIMEREELPQIRAALSARIPETITLLRQIAFQALASGGRHMAFVVGVPGAGKTLVGLQFVYETTFSPDGPEQAPQAIFLSGNRSLVEVLQYVLKSRVFVQPMRNFILEHGVKGRPTSEHVLVFDEAQRAWDRQHVEEKHGTAASEPDLLIGIADRIPDWGMVVGLIGQGQEIHLGEEAGLAQWNHALQKSSCSWHVHAPPQLASVFSAAAGRESHRLLSLDVSLRSHRAQDVHNWVGSILGGEVEKANLLAATMRREGFTVYVTRDLDLAKTYVRERYSGQPGKRYGLLASSKAQNLPAVGIDNSWNATRRIRIGPWFNDEPASPTSGCALSIPITEFQCQGLELDMPIVCWGTDLTWNDGWQSRITRSKARDPHQLRLNSYRVLLTRGRDGVVIFVPPAQGTMSDVLGSTHHILLACGARALARSLELTA